MNFFQGPFDTADGTEDHSGDDDVDAVVRDALHILGESNDETFQFDVRMIGLLLEKLLLEKGIDFDDRQFTFGRVKFEIVAGTGPDFEYPQSAFFSSVQGRPIYDFPSQSNASFLLRGKSRDSLRA